MESDDEYVEEKKFVTWDYNGNMRVFEFDKDFGAKKGQAFHGKLTDRPDSIPIHIPIEIKREDDQILVIEASQLRSLSAMTLWKLKNSRIVITDSSSDMTNIIKSLQQHVKDNPNDYINRTWDECFPQRFLTINNNQAFSSLKQILQHGSPQFAADDDGQEEDIDEYMEEFGTRMKTITMFAHLVEDDFWKSGTKSSLKTITIKQF